jgi:hypothetical protein
MRKPEKVYIKRYRPAAVSFFDAFLLPHFKECGIINSVISPEGALLSRVARQTELA